MSIENIRNRILKTAEAEAAAVVAEAEAAAGRMLAQARAEAAERQAKAESETRTRLQQQYDSRIAAALAANRLELLKRKSAILDGFFDEAVVRFVDDRSGDYRRWLGQRLESVADEAGAICAAKDDRTLIEELLAELQRKGGGGRLAMSDEEAAIRGGFVLRTEQIDMDLSLDTWLADLRQDLLPELAARTFADGGGRTL